MKILWLAVPVCLLLGATLHAEETEEAKPPKHSPEWTNPRPGDPGVRSVATDLQKIVVLCATDHNSAEFKRAWSNYVRKNELQGDKLDATIRRVVNEAFRHRQEMGQKGGSRRLSDDWKTGASKAMHDVAMKSIQNTRA